MWEPKSRIIVPVDFSPSSMEAIRTALDLAAEPGSVHVIHVVPIAEAHARGLLSGHFDQPAAIERAERHLETYLGTREIGGVRKAVLVGNPGRSIVEYADSCHAELIVIPSHGYHGLRRLLLGSVAERVARHASCPVLLLRRRAEDD